MGFDTFSYEGKHALVVGGATGMGAAAAGIVKELGGSVTVLDIADIGYEVDQSLWVDLRVKETVVAAIAQITGPIDAVFSCAGVADGSEGIMSVNFISQRYIIDTLANTGVMPRGSAVTIIASVGGLGWERSLDVINDFLDTPDWESADAWTDRHPELANYGFSKQAINVYVRRSCLALLQKGIRINALEPGPTDTPLARANADVWLGFASDYRAEAGYLPATPNEQAYPMVFLNSRAASYISGISVLTDLGYVESATVGAYESPIVSYLKTGT